jgi:hypothetical protein
MAGGWVEERRPGDLVPGARKGLRASPARSDHPQLGHGEGGDGDAVGVLGLPERVGGDVGQACESAMTLTTRT